MADKDNKGRFTKGNKAGTRSKRTASLANQIKKSTEDGKVMIDKLLTMFRSEKTSNRDKIEIAKLLLAYSYGKPVAHTIIEGEINTSDKISPQVEEVLDALNPATKS